jgi:hypothetical protein
MKGEIINCPAHKDIYFLETNTKPEVSRSQRRQSVPNSPFSEYQLSKFIRVAGRKRNVQIQAETET